MENEHVINNDVEAEKRLLEIKEIKEDCKRKIDCCKEMIAYYQDKIEKIDTDKQMVLIIYESQLREYFSRVEHKSTKTQESYSLPSGKLKLKHQKPEIKRDEKVLLEWCSDNHLDDVIKVKESVDWEKLKKELKFEGKNAISPDGEIVPGVELIERDPEFVVEV